MAKSDLGHLHGVKKNMGVEFVADLTFLLQLRLSPKTNNLNFIMLANYEAHSIPIMARIDGYIPKSYLLANIFNHSKLSS